MKKHVLVVAICAASVIVTGARGVSNAAPQPERVTAAQTVGALPQPSTPSDPVFNRVIDLLDEDVAISEDNFWTSEVFDAAPFTSFVLAVRGAVFASSFECHLRWRFVADEPAAEPADGGGTVLLNSGVGARVSAVRPVNGIKAEVACGAPHGVAGVLSDVKVLLRRE